MKKKFYIGLLLIVVSFIFSIGTVSAEKIEFIDKDGSKYAYNEAGEVKTGLFEYKGKTYYANENGVLQNEVQEIDGKKYFFGKTTFYMWKGRINNWGDILITDDSGVVQTGLFDYNGQTYYANENGVLQNEVQEIDGKKYFFGKTTFYMWKGKINNWGDILITDDSGVVQTGLFDYNGQTYFANENGVLQKYIQEYNGKKYFFDGNNYNKKIGWITYKNKTYYANSEGQLVNTDQTIDGILYRFNDDCSLKSGWQGKTYILDDGSKATGWQTITGKKYYFNSDGEMMGENVKKVVDVSSWQDTINWELVKNDGVDGAIIRVGWGMTSYDAPGFDSRFDYNIKEVKRLNIPYALYIYGYAEYDFSARNEAKFVKETMEKYGIPKDTYIFYDAEEPISLSTYEMVIPTFVETMHNYGYKNVGVYGSVSYFEYGRLNSNRIKQYPVWVAQYYKKNQYEGDYVGWQYCSDGRINGINGNVDVNMFKISF